MNFAKFKELLPHYGYQMVTVGDHADLRKKLKPAYSYAVISADLILWYVPKVLGTQAIQELVDAYQNRPLRFDLSLRDDPEYLIYQAYINIATYDDVNALLSSLYAGFCQAFVVDDKAFIYPNLLALLNPVLVGRSDIDPHDVQAVQKAVDQQPESAILQNYLGKLLLEKNDPGKAAHCFANACQAEPLYAEPYSNLGTVMWSGEHREEAFKLFGESMVRNPFEVTTQDNFIRAGSDLGKTQEMLETINRCTSYYPEYLGLTYLKAILVAQGGDRAEGMALLRRLLEVSPDDSRARELLTELQQGV